MSLAHRGSARQFAAMARAYWSSGPAWKIQGAVWLLTLLTVAQVALAIWISYWHRDLFDALEARRHDELLQLCLVFLLIFGLTMAVTAAHLQVKRWLQLDWRRWMTSLLLEHWMSRSHHYKLQFLGGEHDNPDGRIAEDIRIATEVAISLAHTLLFSLLILGSFIDILLAVSGSAALPGTSVSIPGYLVLAAFLYAGSGAALGLLLGRPLIRTTNWLQTVEANLRFNLARARQHSEAIALMHGEAMERQSARRLFADVGRGWNRQTLAYLGIVSFTTGYGTLLPVFPILIAAPQYMAGAMSLGLLMQAAQAFQRLTSALSWPVDNLGEIARCRASMDRIVSLYRDMQQLEAAEEHPAACTAHIQLRQGSTASLSLEQLTLLNANGEPLLENLELRLAPGERLLITGDPAVSVALFKAVAGLWPWGHGSIHLPADARLMFLPQQPFLPEGSLRAALSYPHDPGQYSSADYEQALAWAGLSWLSARLDSVEDWGQLGHLRSRQRLGLARLFLQQPDWIFLEEATDALEAEDERLSLEKLHQHLPQAALLHISQHRALFSLYPRQLILKRLPNSSRPPRT